MSSGKHIIIYHAHCNDGFGAAWAAATSVSLHMEQIVFVEGKYGEPPPYEQMSPEDTVHILDFSYAPEDMMELAANVEEVIWIDHHKSALENWDNYICNNFDDGEEIGNSLITVLDLQKCGAMLAWEYYHPNEEPPTLIQYIQDRDLWKKELPDSDAFTLALNTYPKGITEWTEIALQTATEKGLGNFLAEGRAVERYYFGIVLNLVRNVREAVLRYPYTCAIISAVNCNGMFASDVGNALATADPNSIGLTWELLAGPELVIKGSLRSVGDVDVAAIAKALGGGGHKNAAGFTLRNNSAALFLETFTLDLR